MIFLIKKFYISRVQKINYFIINQLLKDKKIIQNRSLRAALLRQTILLLHSIIKIFELPVKLVFDKDVVIQEFSDIKLYFNTKNIGHANRYLKPQKNYDNMSVPILKLTNLDYKEKYTIVDLGASIGELSIFMAKKFPKSKIYAVEANYNYANYLKENMLLNEVSNIEVINMAISDKDDLYYKVINTEINPEIKQDLGQKLNVIESFDETDKKSITLNKIIENFNIKKIDLLKIHIEESNSKTLNCIIKNKEKIDRICLEIGFSQPKIFINFYQSIKNYYDFFILRDGRQIQFEELCKKTEYLLSIQPGFDLYLEKKIS